MPDLERRIIAGSRDICIGNPAIAQQPIKLIDFTDGSRQIVCPQRTADGFCSVANSTVYPCIQPDVTPSDFYNPPPLPDIPDVIERKLPSGLVVYDRLFHVVEAFPTTDKSVDLSPREDHIFMKLLMNPGSVIPQRELSPNVSNAANATRVHIRRIRTKLDDPRSVIQSVPGVGYRMT